MKRCRRPSYRLLLALLAGTGCSSDPPSTQPGTEPLGDSAVSVPPDGATLSDAGTAFNTLDAAEDSATGSAPLDGSRGEGAPDAASTVDAGHTEVRRDRPIEGGQVPGAITGSQPPFAIKDFDLSSYGYVEEEFFLEGEATQYAADGELGLDGMWHAVPNGQAPYRTRLLVRRPALPGDFNGTVLVEWLNTTGQLDAEIGFALAFEELLRGGYAWVGVSVQQSGVDLLKTADSERYASLQHPGDPYCYDIFAQAGAAIGWPGEVDPMQDLKVERLIAYGESQSAMRMITFVNAVQPLSHVFDGVIIHSRAGWGAPIGTEGNGLLGNGKPVRVREDSDARVLQFFTESELFLQLGPAYAARQPDSPKLRTWEVAGTAHADQHLLGDGTDLGCGVVNDGPQHVVIKAAIRGMHKWLKDGTPPPMGPPIAVNAEGNDIERDEHGNALGGVRTPAVDVPIATLSGEPPPGMELNPLCMLLGQTIPFTPEQLRALYPTHRGYVDAVRQAASAARKAGFILPEEEASIAAEATAAPIP
jgi:hypothetical protein